MLIVFRVIVVYSYINISFILGFLASVLRPFHPDNVFFLCSLLRPVLPVLGIKLKIEGRNIMKEVGPCVFISNHQNNYDLFMAARAMVRRTVSLGKSSIKYIPFFGQFYWLSGNILIKRENTSKAMKAMGKVRDRIINENLSVWILPEGTRAKGRELLPFKKGAFYAAIQAEIPVVPICFSTYHGKIHLNKLHSGLVLAKVLDPIPTKGMVTKDAASLAKFCHDLMKKTIADLDEEVEKKMSVTSSFTLMEGIILLLRKIPVPILKRS